MTRQAFSASQERWHATISFSGAVVWAILAALAGLRHAPFGIMELLFLFAPLVIVPLGLQLAEALDERAGPGLTFMMRGFHVIAAIAVCISFWMPPGGAAAGLSALWFLNCLVLAGRRFALQQCQSESHSWLPIFTLNVAALDLILGSAWLLASRAGFRPMGFQEPIVLLTAIHLHFSGFATATLAAATLHTFDRRSRATRGLQLLVLFITILPFVLAAGFVFSPLLRLVAAIALSVCVTLLAGTFLWVSRQLRIVPARFYLRAAGCAAIGAFALAGLYAFSEYFAKGWITIPAMANYHGVLNGLGFVLLSLLAWNMELHSVYEDSQWSMHRKPSKERRTYPLPPSRKPPAKAPAPLPEFAAREFYDR